MKVLWFYPGNRPEEICVVPYGIREIKCAAFAHSCFRKIIIIQPTVRIIRNWFGCGSNIIENVIIQQCKERVNFDEDHLFSDVPGKNNSIIHYDSRCVNVRSCKSRHANSHDNIVRISFLVFFIVK